MTDAPTKVYIEPGRRQGRTLSNEAQFRTAIADGKEPYTRLNGVWFAVSFDGDAAVYTALTKKPEGL